jgi:hypothetical protein
LIYKDLSADISGMNPKAVPQAGLKGKFGLSLALAVVGLMSVVFAGSAAAAPITKGGQVHACYRVKGKAKGAMRVVPVNKKCRRGEKKLAWSVAGPVGQQGAAGPQGAQGQSGSNGSNGADGSGGTSGTTVAALETKIASLTLEVGNLEGILSGVTNTGLTKAVGALPVVDSLCVQANSIPIQFNNSLGGILSGLSLGGTIPALLSLNVPALTPITSYTCPS